MATNALRVMMRDTSPVIEFQPSIAAFLFKSAGGWLTLALSLPLWGIPLIFVAMTWLGYRMTHYRLEGDRLFMRRGILSRSEEEIELYRIKDIKATYSIVQQMFGVGSLTILSSDATGLAAGRRSAFAIHNIDHIRELREELRERVDVARRRKGVREFDAA